MPMFVSDERVPIVDPDTGNTIVIRGKMDYRIMAAVQDAFIRLNLREPADEVSGYMATGSREMALLTYNIVSWSGPDFDGIPCTAAMIGRLDPNEPFIDRVLEEIGLRNAKRVTATERKKTTPPGGATGQDVVDFLPVATPSMSSLPNSTTGQNGSPVRVTRTTSRS